MEPEPLPPLPPPPPYYKDRSTALAVFGFMQIALGLLAVLLSMLMLFAMAMSPMAGATGQTASMVPALLIYGAASVWFLVMGSGSILCRRWARALSLAAAWMGLTMGLASVTSMFVIMPQVLDNMGPPGQPEADFAATIGLYIGAGVMGVFFVVIPGVLILFYSSRNVLLTCEARDARTRWTDRCPTPVLALSLLWAFTVLGMGTMGAYNWAFPMFGVLLDGPAGAACVVGMAAGFAYASWALARLRWPGWWAGLILVLIIGLSSIVTFPRIDLAAYYAQMGLPPEQIEMSMKMFPNFGRSMVVWCGVWVVAQVGFLLWIRRYFKRDAGGVVGDN